MERKPGLIEEILKLEFDMFQRVPTVSPTVCQESEGGFRLVRGSGFETWSEATLESYRDDLLRAMGEGRNLLTEKYARMDDLIPCLNFNPLIDDIIKIESEWQSEARSKYPRILGGGEACQAEGFETYLRGELETYSDQTLDLYYRDISQGLREGRNLAEERYLKMSLKLGYSSLEEHENALKAETA
ncbi:MAG: DUF4125 family protein [Chloroflexota bacterium]|nr:DUF4125 family protein [Chloroflexota bacterium]